MEVKTVERERAHARVRDAVYYVSKRTITFATPLFAAGICSTIDVILLITYLDCSYVQSQWSYKYDPCTYK